MSLVGTLGKLAVGALVAKGIGKVVQNKMGGAGGASPLGGGVPRPGSSGDMGNLLGGKSGSAPAGGGGGLADLIGGLAGGAGGAGGGGLADLLGGAMGGGAGGAAGGLGGLLESLGGAQGGQAGGAGGLGDLLNSAIRGQQRPADIQSTPDQEAAAELMMRAMLNAAKSDGRLDEAEQRKIQEHLGDDVTAEDMQWIQRELQAPLDTDAFVRSVPRGMEQQVYLMSLMSIDLDSKPEAEYLDKLGKGLGLSESVSNQIHAKLGVPTLYT